jgi:hypothetical protein
MMITKSTIRKIVKKILKENNDNDTQHLTTNFEWHLSRVGSSIRLMVYGKSGSTFFEAQDNPSGPGKLSALAARAGYHLDPRDIEDELEST